MHISKFPPMAGGSDGHEVICIEAKRVCDFCFQEHRVDRTFPFPTNVVFPPGIRPMIECRIDEENVVCRVVEQRIVDCNKNQTLVCLAIEVPVILTVNDTEVTERVVFLKQAVICVPEGTEPECRVTGNCCCFADTTSRTVSCVFNFCVVIQSKVDVRVLIPTLGMCAPKECRTVAGGCPPGNVARPCGPCNDRSDSTGC